MDRQSLYVPFSKEFVKTNTETEEVMKLLEQNGFVKQMNKGLYSFLPLGKKIINKLENHIRAEMDFIGGQEVDTPAIQPASLWNETGRLEQYGNNMFRIGNNNKYVLAPTAEEAFVDLVRNGLKKRSDFPVVLYQFGKKYRNESVRGGIVRSLEFIMKDAYSFHTSTKDLQKTFKNIENSYRRLFSLFNIKFGEKSVDPEEMGGSYSKEFIAITPLGNESIDNTQGIEIGHIFMLGNYYAQKMNLKIRDEKNNTTYPEMGCYGIGVSRLIPTIASQNKVKDYRENSELLWPISVSPFPLVVISTAPKNNETSNKIYNELCKTINYSDVLIDNRKIRPGNKFKEYDKLGIPFKIIVGKSYNENALFEIEQKTKKEKITELYNHDDLIAFVNSEIIPKLKEDFNYNFT